MNLSPTCGCVDAIGCPGTALQPDSPRIRWVTLFNMLALLDMLLQPQAARAFLLSQPAVLSADSSCACGRSARP
jgi:hypothetical protein